MTNAKTRGINQVVDNSLPLGYIKTMKSINFPKTRHKPKIFFKNGPWCIGIAETKNRVVLYYWDGMAKGCNHIYWYSKI